MDITPLITAASQTINGYGAGEFIISGVHYPHSVLVFPSHVQSWNGELSAEALSPVTTQATELLLIGTGVSLIPVTPALRQYFRALGIAVEAMDTGAACRTYNVLLAEGRQIAAALLQV